MFFGSDSVQPGTAASAPLQRGGVLVAAWIPYAWYHHQTRVAAATKLLGHSLKQPKIPSRMSILVYVLSLLRAVSL